MFNREEANRLAEQGRQEAQRGCTDRALALYDQALALLNGSRDELLVNVLRWKGTAFGEIGQTRRAMDFYRRSVDVANELGHRCGSAEGLNALATIAMRRGALHEADALYKDAARFAAQANAQLVLGRIEQNQGILANIRGDWELAHSYYESSVHAFVRGGDEEAVSWGLNNLGKLCTAQGQYSEAEAVFDRGLAIARSRESRLVEGLLELNRAEMLFLTGRVSEAHIGCARSLELAALRGDSLRQAEALRLRSSLERSDNRLDAALETLREAAKLANEAEDLLLGAEVLRDMGEVLRQQGRNERARAALERSRGGFSKLGAVRDIADVDERLLRLAA